MKKSKSTPVKKTLNHSGVNSRQPKESPQKESPSIEPGAVQTICDICAQNVPGPEREKIFALGKCDHPVCYVCSARLRAICEQFECPICRDKLECVIFSANKEKAYESHDTGNYIFNDKFNIYFEDATIKNAFAKLLRFECMECHRRDRSTEPADKTLVEKDFQDSSKLKRHLSIEHELTLCDLCLRHNKLFPFEYSYYNNASLRRHMQNGELNTSHKGHPKCQLCKDTFFNQDDLLLHMSREHYHCHLCARNNTSYHVYFLDYPSLREHFQNRHYLCRHGNCLHEQFTSAFDDKISYQIHLAEVHGSGVARHQRITLDSAPHRAPVESGNLNNIPNAAIVPAGNPATANDPNRQVPETIQQQIRQQRLPAQSEFPQLGDAPARRAQPTSGIAVPSNPSTSQYPSLAPTNSTQPSRIISIQHRVIAGPSSSRPSFVRCAGGGNVAVERLNESDFPPLPEQPRDKKSKAKARPSRVNGRAEELTLHELINSSLTLSPRNLNKGRSNKSNKSAKQKAIKIQL